MLRNVGGARRESTTHLRRVAPARRPRKEIDFTEDLGSRENADPTRAGKATRYYGSLAISILKNPRSVENGTTIVGLGVRW